MGGSAELLNVRFGSLADLQDSTTLVSAFGGKAVITPSVNYAKNGNLIARYHNHENARCRRDVEAQNRCFTGHGHVCFTPGSGHPRREISRDANVCGRPVDGVVAN